MKGDEVRLDICDGCYFLSNVRFFNLKESEMAASDASPTLNELTAPFVFFTTHFPAMGQLHDRYLNVVKYVLLNTSLKCNNCQ